MHIQQLNHKTYDSNIRACLKDLLRECISSQTEHLNLNEKVSLLRVWLSNLLLEHNGEIPYYILRKIDMILQYELSIRKLIKIDNIPEIKNIHNVHFFEGDITLIKSDIIVNSGNPLGCFFHGYKCPENKILLRGGPEIRTECGKKMPQAGIMPGEILISRGYNLPAKYVFHVTPPVYSVSMRHFSKDKLELCYTNCLNHAKDLKLKSIAFPSIGTNPTTHLYSIESHTDRNYPRDEASVIAIRTISRWLEQNSDYEIKIIFVLEKYDLNIYEQVIMSPIWKS